jgi:hypothetical protein
MNKIQKPSFSKVNKHSKHDEHQHNCGCNHNHSHDELYGELNEVPAVVSYSISFQFDKEVTAHEVQVSLVDWMERLKQWVLENKYFIGHIKIFAEGEKDFNLWISTTGKKINIIGSWDEDEKRIQSITMNMTVIIFGPNEQTLRAITLETLKKTLPHHSE